MKAGECGALYRRESAPFLPIPATILSDEGHTLRLAEQSLKKPGYFGAFMELYSSPGLLIPGFLRAVIKFYMFKLLLI